MALNNRLHVFEILEKASKLKSRDERIEMLQQHKNMPLLDVLRGTFDNTIQWNLPDGTPPYTPNAEDAPSPSSLLKQHMNFKHFVKGLRESSSLSAVKRERMFIDLLESVSPQDASVVVSMINKKSPYKGITKKLVQDAFPDLIVE